MERRSFLKSICAGIAGIAAAPASGTPTRRAEFNREFSIDPKTAFLSSGGVDLATPGSDRHALVIMKRGQVGCSWARQQIMSLPADPREIERLLYGS